jgi:hypothetical protein
MSSLHLICKKSLKIPKRWSESIIRKKGQTNNYKMANNDQHKSSPKSTLSVIGIKTGLTQVLANV